jgi:hypothetical protein
VHSPLLAGLPLDSDHMNLMEDWGTYTPQLDTTGLPDPSLGTGSAEGFWHRRGIFIDGWARFHFGATGASAGNGTYRISLPFDAHPTLNSASLVTGAGTHLGLGWIQDDDTAANSQPVGCQLAAVGEMRLLRHATSLFVSSTSPIPWAAQDRISVPFHYIADPAALPDEPVTNLDAYRGGYAVPGRTTRQLDAYQRFTPLIENGTSGDFVNLGADGESVGWFRRSGRWVEGEVRFRFSGAGIDPAGAATFHFYLPTAIHSPPSPTGISPGQGAIIGDGRIRDQSVAANSKVVVVVPFNETGQVTFEDGFPVRRSTARLGYRGSNSVFLPGSPFALAENDRVSFRFAYLSGDSFTGGLQ